MLQRPGNGDTSRRLFGSLPRRLTFWALRDVSFEIRRGETLGIVGPNRSGKTTLIRLLSGITAPTTGEIEINGRLASLVEVGAGFQPDLTGRENIFLNGADFRMRYREIARKLPAIVDFAEINEFLDVPVKRYSSGMFVRLGFAIAAHLSADILLLDEVLAVGDVAFQARCFERIEALRRKARPCFWSRTTLRPLSGGSAVELYFSVPGASCWKAIRARLLGPTMPHHLHGPPRRRLGRSSPED